MLSSGQGGLWAVKLVGGLPPTLVDGLVPRPLSLYHFGGTVKYGALGIAFKEFAGESGSDSLGDLRN